MNPRKESAEKLPHLVSGGHRGPPLPSESQNTGRAVVFLVILGFWGQACSSNRGLPPFPKPAWESFQPVAREEVEKRFQQAQATPADPDANGRLGMILHAFEQYDAALTCYKRAHQLDPASFRWTYYIGTVQTSLGKEAEAIRSLRAALRIKPQEAAARLRLAELLLSAGAVLESREAYVTFLAELPDSAAAHYGLGRVLAAQGETSAAIEHYLEACRISERFAAAHYALALAYRDLGETEKSQTHLSAYDPSEANVRPFDDPWMEAINELKSSSANFHLNEGMRLEAAEDLSRAVAAYRRTLEIDPEKVQAHINLISAYGKLGQVENAEAEYRNFVSIDPGYEEGHYNFGVLMVIRGRHAEAVQAFEKAIEINPQSAVSHNNLGIALEQVGREDEAARHYRVALSHRPNFRLAHFQLGRHLQKRGRYRQALDHLLKTLTPEDERTPGFLYALADCYVKLGDIENGLHYARKALQAAVDFQQSDLAEAIQRDVAALERAAAGR